MKNIQRLFWKWNISPRRYL